MGKGSNFLPWVILGAGGIAIYRLQGLGDSASNLSVRVVDVKPGRPAGGKVKTQVSLECSNPGRSDLALNFVDAEIRLGNSVIGVINENSFAALRASNPQYGVIKARSRSILTFSVSTRIAESLINILLDVLSNQSAPKTVTLKGFVMAAGVRVPIEHSQPVLSGLGAAGNMAPTYSPSSDYSPFFIGGTNTTLESQKVWQSGKVLPSTIEAIKQAYKYSIPQVVGLARILKDPDFAQSCFNIYDFITRNIRYKKDVPGYEQIRTAARSWQERATGVDCEDYAILTAALLKNMGYSAEFEIVGFGSGFAHIFTVAHHNGQSIVIDCTPYMDGLGPVVPFNERPSGIIETMKVEILNGLDGGMPSAMVAGIGGLHPRTLATQKLMDAQSQVLQIAEKSGRTDVLPGKLRAIRTGILLNGLEDQDVFIGALPFISDVKPNGNMIFQPGLTPDDVVELGEYLGVLEAWQQTGYNPELKMQDLEGLGSIAFDRTTENAESQLAEGVGSWLSKRVKKLKSKVSNTVRKGAQVAKNSVSKVKQGMKTFVKNPLYFINKINPATVVIRNSVLAILRLNLFKFSTRIKWGYLTEEEARKRGYDMKQWKKLRTLVSSLENVFNKLGGEKKNLRNAILKGGKGIGEIGVAPAAGAAAATPIIVKIAAWLKDIDFKALFGKNPSKEEMEASSVVSEPTQEEISAKVPTQEENASTYNSPAEMPTGQRLVSANLKESGEGSGTEESPVMESAARIASGNSGSGFDLKDLALPAAAAFALILLAR